MQKHAITHPEIKKHKFTTLEMECVLMQYHNPRVNLPIPNVSWGFFNHECDIILMSQAGYLTEIEIKVSLGDLKKDREKKHQHFDEKISKLYFAIPEKLEKHIEHIPENAGIYVVRLRKQYENYRYVVEELRGCGEVRKYKISDGERLKLLRLSSLRISSLKKKLFELKSSNTL